MKRYEIWSKITFVEYRMGYEYANSKKELRERFKNERLDLSESEPISETVRSEVIHSIEEVKEGGE